MASPLASMTGESKVLIAEAEALGWERVRKSKHSMLMRWPASGAIVGIPGTPGDIRSLKNSRAELYREMRRTHTEEEPVETSTPTSVRPYPIRRRGILDMICWVVCSYDPTPVKWSQIESQIRSLGPEYGALLDSASASVKQLAMTNRVTYRREDRPQMFKWDNGGSAVRWSGEYEKRSLTTPELPPRGVAPTTPVPEVPEEEPEVVDAEIVEPVEEQVYQAPPEPAPTVPAVLPDPIGVVSLIEIMGKHFDGGYIGRDESGTLYRVLLKELK